MHVFTNLSYPYKLGETELHLGDIVSLNTRFVKEEIVTAFLGYLPDTKQYLFLLPNAIATRHGLEGTFAKGDIFAFNIREGAARAVPLESGEQHFSQKQRVKITGTGQSGSVIAAIRGTIALQFESGEVAIGLKVDQLESIPSASA